jgi:lipoate-protein ligase A
MRVACNDARKLGDFLCFLDQTPGDLVVNNAKVAGSAQRKLRGALLQHGSILLRQSPLTPELPGIAEQSGVQISAADLRAALSSALVAETQWILIDMSWTEAESRQRHGVAHAKYASERWNHRR